MKVEISIHHLYYLPKESYFKCERNKLLKHVLPKIENPFSKIERNKQIKPTMNITINYTGTIGTGHVAIEVNPEATMKELLTTFHEAIQKDDFYTIQGGAPPNRRAMKVHYDYYINGKLLKDIHAKVATLRLSESDTIKLQVDKGMRVD